MDLSIFATVNNEILRGARLQLCPCVLHRPTDVDSPTSASRGRYAESAVLRLQEQMQDIPDRFKDVQRKTAAQSRTMNTSQMALVPPGRFFEGNFGSPGGFFLSQRIIPIEPNWMGGILDWDLPETRFRLHRH